MVTICLAFAPFTLAGTPEDPEVRDAEGDALGPAIAYGDLTRGWIEQSDPESVEIHIEIAMLHRPIPITAYVMVFDAVGEKGPRAYYAGAIIFDETYFFAGKWDREGLGPEDEGPVSGSLTAGAPAHVQVSVPLAHLGKNVTHLENIGLYVFDHKSSFFGGDMVTLDEATGERPFLVTPATEEPAGSLADAADASASVPVPAPALALGLAGALAAACARRRR